MNADNDALGPGFRGPFPIFTVSDLPRSLAFFRDAFGFEVTDIHTAWDVVMEHGAAPITPSAQERWNEWSAFLADPSGLRIMLYARI